MLISLLEKLKKSFPYSSDAQKNSLIDDCFYKIKQSLINHFESFKIKIAEKKIGHEFDQNKKRGVNALTKIAKNLRKKAYKEKL